MQIFSLIGNQIKIMYMLVIFGYLIYKFKLINQNAASKTTSFLVWVVNPLIILASYQTKFEMEKFKNLGIAFFFSFVSMVFVFVFTHVIFKKNTRMERFALGFGNAGFMGIPLVTGILGLENVFYLSAYLACFNLFSYTYGIYLITGDTKNISIGRIIKNPGVITVIAGLVLYAAQLKLPVFLYNTCNFMSNLNTPIAMMLLGTYVAKLNLIEIFFDKKAYYISFLKLLFIPVLVSVLLRFIPFGTHDIKMVILIATATPVALTVPMFSEIYGGDYMYGAKIVSLSTLLSLLNLPIALSIGTKIMF